MDAYRAHCGMLHAVCWFIAGGLGKEVGSVEVTQTLTVLLWVESGQNQCY